MITIAISLHLYVYVLTKVVQLGDAVTTSALPHPSVGLSPEPNAELFVLELRARVLL